MTRTAVVMTILAITLIDTLFLMAQDGNRHVRALETLPPVFSLTNFFTYANSSFGVSMDYPADWKKVEDNTGSWFRNTNDSVHVRIESLPNQDKSIDELTLIQLNLTKNQFPGQIILESNATTIGNVYPAHKIEFTFPEEPTDPKGTTFKELKTWTIEGGKAYIITYFTTDDSYSYYLPFVEKMIKSIMINQTTN